MNIRKISDEKLYQLCKEFGDKTRLWRQRFIGLLPEVNRRKLYKKKGFGSVFEMAAKMAGLSREQVARALSLDQKFDDKPALKSLLVNGEARIHKLARVVSIATVENEKELAEQVQRLPQKALETLVRDEKILATGDGPDSESRINKTLFGDDFVRVEDPALAVTHKLELAEDVENELAELQRKGLDVNELLREFLRRREEDIVEEKEKIVKEINNIELARSGIGGRIGCPQGKKPSRYIRVKVRGILQKEHGTKCSIPPCNKPAKVIHHTQRFALAGTHNPYYLAPLCDEHHKIAHSIDGRFCMEVARNLNNRLSAG